MSQEELIRQGAMFLAEVPRMPEGYYSGDKPNPNIRAFVEAHLRERPYDPATDDYTVPAFDRPIETTKATAIYNMHTYWSKKPHDAIQQYIRHYTQPGDLVLDPFCGSGSTALAALMEGRKAIAIDRSPAATFITKNYCTPVDPQELQSALEEVKRRVGPDMDWLYETRCDRCGGPATTGYTVYSQVFQCPRCLEKVALFDCVEVEGRTGAGKPKKVSVCPHCHARGHEEEISTRAEKYGAIPVLVSYLCRNGCKPARGERRHNDPDPAKREYFIRYDLGKLREIEEREIPYWYPPHRMMNVEDNSSPWGAEWREGRNFRTVAELFTKRNLWALSAIRSAILTQDASRHREPLLAAMTGTMLHLSRMSHHKDGGGGIMVGTYYLPQVCKERNALSNYSDKARDIVAAMAAGISEITPEVCISTQSSCSLEPIPSDSIDYVFTDPPYADKVQYGELNFVWEAWLGFDTNWHDEEIIVNEVRGKSEADWADMMRLAMAECYRVLKPGRWLSLCYHDTSEGTWQLIQDIMAEAGFVADRSSNTALFIDAGQKSYNQLTADKANKRDLVINFRKPKEAELGAASAKSDGDAEEAQPFRETARRIIRDYLQANPGSTKDRIYDELVSRLVRSGQMEAHNFEEILREVADEVKEPRMADLFTPENPNLFGTHEVSRWFLKETEETTLDAAQSAQEDAAAGVLRRYIEKQFSDQAHLEGVHYSDLFEHYVYGVKEKPRRQMADWLVDYFYKTEEGTWRPPATDDEVRLKTEGRAAGVNRRIKRFATMLASGASIPPAKVPSPATLAEWIRYAKRAGMYDAGRLLYERGGLDMSHLAEEAQVDVEEDYQVCLRALQRAAGGSGEGKRGRHRTR